MSKDITVTYSGIGFPGLLTIAFIVLKLCNIINWSWLWILSPIWISFGIWLIVATIIIITLYIYRMYHKGRW